MARFSEFQFKADYTFSQQQQQQQQQQHLTDVGLFPAQILPQLQHTPSSIFLVTTNWGSLDDDGRSLSTLPAKSMINVTVSWRLSSRFGYHGSGWMSTRWACYLKYLSHVLVTDQSPPSAVITALHMILF